MSIIEVGVRVSADKRQSRLSSTDIYTPCCAQRINAKMLAKSMSIRLIFIVDLLVASFVRTLIVSRLFKSGNRAVHIIS